MNRLFIITIFPFLFSTLINAQQPPPLYGFLEVVDSKNEPIFDASVCQGNCEKTSKYQARFLEQTNQKGQLKKGIRFEGYFPIPFSIYKEGYYSFFDCFGLFRRWSNDYRFPNGQISNSENPIKIELLKIPQTDAERETLGNEQSKREFFLAIYNNDIDSLRKLLKSSINPNLTTKDLRGVPIPRNLSAIVYAAELHNNQALAELLSAGADISSKESPAKNVLINYLLTIPQPDQSRQTIEEQKREMVKYGNGVELLLKSGVDIHLVSSQGETALTIAMSRGFLEIFKNLVAKDFSQKEKSDTLRQLILSKVDKDSDSLEFANLLIKSGADTNYLVGKNKELDSRSCESLLMTAGMQGKIEFAKLLLKNKADINFVCENGYSPLISAVAAGKIESVNFFLDSGAKFDAVGEWRRTALIEAVERRNIEIVKLLLERGAPVDATDKWDGTALQEAITWYGPGGRREIEMAEVLLIAGANPNRIDKNCYTPLRYAAGHDHNKTHLIKLLIAYKADVNLNICKNADTPIVDAARRGHLESLKILLEAGANVKGKQGRRALNYAKELLKDEGKKANAEEIIKLFEAAGAK